MKRPHSVPKNLLHDAAILLGAFLAAVLINSTLIVNIIVPTGSMIPTLQIGDRAIGFRFAYWFSNPARGDIVVFWAPDETQTQYVKRVIGLPGEKVEIKAGRLFIDDALNEDYAELDTNTHGDWGPYFVPESCYFMLGDNRNSSLDARYWNNKFVPRDDILGKIQFCYWPRFRVPM